MTASLDFKYLNHKKAYKTPHFIGVNMKSTNLLN